MRIMLEQIGKPPTVTKSKTESDSQSSPDDDLTSSNRDSDSQSSESSQSIPGQISLSPLTGKVSIDFGQHQSKKHNPSSRALLFALQEIRRREKHRLLIEDARRKEGYVKDKAHDEYLL